MGEISAVQILRTGENRIQGDIDQGEQADNPWPRRPQYCPTGGAAKIEPMASPLPTLLFCTAYMAEESWWQGRYKPWIDHYQTLPLRRDATFVLDDSSPYVPSDHRLAILSDLPPKVGPEKIHLYRFAEHIGNDKRNRRRGWWRSFLFSLEIARQYGSRSYMSSLTPILLPRALLII